MEKEETPLTAETMTPDTAKMEAVGRLAGGVAHDFNNILGAIEGYATLILNTLRPEDPIKPDLEEIRKAVARAAALTRQLLVLSRRQALQKKACRANEFAENLKKPAPAAEGGAVELKLDLGQGLPDVFADPGQLEQLLLNLVENACEAMPGGGTVTVRTRLVELEPASVKSPAQAEAGTSFVTLSVIDTGRGISRAALEHLFEPFFTTKAKGKGKGLGLSAVYGIAKQHNGWVEVKSQEGAGAEFSVYLPARNQ